jgi:predicted permease
VAVARLQIRDLGRAGLLCVIRFMVLTAVAWAVGRAFDLPPVAFAVLVVQFATPVAVSSYLLAEKYRAGPDTVAGLVVISTIMSILTLPLLLALFV